MADFTPAPGTRVTVDGVTWEWKCAFVDHALGDWISIDTGEHVDDVRTPDITSIAELEAKVAELKDELTELRPLARAAKAYRDALARYAAADDDEVEARDEGVRRARRRLLARCRVEKT